MYTSKKREQSCCCSTREKCCGSAQINIKNHVIYYIHQKRSKQSGCCSAREMLRVYTFRLIDNLRDRGLFDIRPKET
jgi:hypothetical protein